MKETSKALIRRLHDIRFVGYFKGSGIDIGSGHDPLTKYMQQFPLITSIKEWDKEDGDAQFMYGVEDESYDFVHSSHCLEHLHDPSEGFGNWIRIVRPGGHIITTIPDEDLYEQGIFPSTFNEDHKTTWTINKEKSWSPVSVNLLEFLSRWGSKIEVLKVDLINASYIYDIQRFDQTFNHVSECAIEFVVRKRTEGEISRRGRFSSP